LASTGTREVLYGPSSLAVRSLSPYEGWESYEQRIEEALKAFVGIATPGPVHRFGVRYVNYIEFSRKEIRLNDYFTSPPSVPEGLGVGMKNFLMRTEFDWDESGVLVIQNFQSAMNPDGYPAAILDIDVVKNY